MSPIEPKNTIRHITPDHPEYAAIAASITPVEKVKGQAFPKNSLYADSVFTTSGRRHETPDKLR